MLSFTDVMHLLAHKLARLRARGFSFSRVFARPFHRCSLRHTNLLLLSVVSPLGARHRRFHVNIGAVGSREETADRTSSVRVEIYFIEPDIERLLFVVPVHLECDVNLFLCPVGLGIVVRIHVVYLIGDADSDVVDLVSDPL